MHNVPAPDPKWCPGAPDAASDPAPKPHQRVNRALSEMPFSAGCGLQYLREDMTNAQQLAAIETSLKRLAEALNIHLGTYRRESEELGTYRAARAALAAFLPELAAKS